MGIPELARDHDVRLVPAMNEELGATAVWGSQHDLPSGSKTHDGVIGFWYGKAPGVDRASDAIRHANTFGAHPDGGVVVLAGDDPGCKSSSIPCASERVLAAMELPVFYPRNGEEVISYGLHAVALSRASGCWVAMKIVADVADGLWTVDRDFGALDLQTPEIEWEGQPWSYQQRAMLDPRDALAAEADLFGPRWEMVKAFNRLNSVDDVEVDPADATIGFLAAGTAYDSLRQALLDLGLGEEDLLRAGVRVMRVGMIYPLDADRIRDFSRGLETIVVVEDKGAFMETQVREILYGVSGAPHVIGKQDVDGRRLVPADGELTAARLRLPLRRLLDGIVALPDEPVAHAADQLPLLPLTHGPRTSAAAAPTTVRPWCPRGLLAGGGIGCHAMVTIEARPTQSGDRDDAHGRRRCAVDRTERVHRCAAHLPERRRRHVLPLRAACSPGLRCRRCQHHLQDPLQPCRRHDRRPGRPGRGRCSGTDPQADRRGRRARSSSAPTSPRTTVSARFADGVTVWHRDRLDEAQGILRDTPGVTALIYDSRCAADARRLRKRGELPVRPTRVVINEMVCEGCGDCGVKSNCLSVQPVDTEFGRKTRIDQNSCNTDYSCLDGDCPSFITFTVVLRQSENQEGHGRSRPLRPDCPTCRPRDAGHLQRVPRRYRRHRHRHGEPGARHRGACGPA